MQDLHGRSPRSKRVVIDVDDTVCFASGRDYANAAPNLPVIEKIAAIRRLGYSVTLYTARGQVSYAGDINKIHENVLPVLVDWLDRNGVEYDELLFGKPYADLYVDDKGVTPDAFVSMEFSE